MGEVCWLTKAAFGQHPLVGGGEVADQHVEMHAACGAGHVPSAPRWPGMRAAARAAGLHGDPARVPLHRSPAQQPSPEACQPPGDGSVQRNLADPADYPGILIVRQTMVNDPCSSRLAGLRPVLPGQPGGCQPSDMPCRSRASWRSLTALGPTPWSSPQLRGRHVRQLAQRRVSGRGQRPGSRYAVVRGETGIR